MKALQNFDFGSQNFAYADVDGNIAYYTSGELPLREDLEAGAVVGLPPMFVRNGEGGNEWLKATSRDDTRSLPFEVLPWAEMPRIVNPPRGFIVNSNNDVTGTSLDNDPFNERRPNGGILYFSSGYSPGARASRITELLAERIAKRGRLTTQDLREIQADTVMRDARYFTPAITTAFANARKGGAHPALAQLAADPRIAEAVARLAAWDQSTPTGIRQGFDASDSPRKLREPDAQEIRHSVAATIYSVWRNQFLADTVDATLRRNGVATFNPVGRAFGRREILSAARNLLDNFDERRGVGASGVNFFEVPGIDDAATRRDFVLLNSVGKALDKLAGDAYATAFKRSTNQDDYRWGSAAPGHVRPSAGCDVSRVQHSAGGRSVPGAARAHTARHSRGRRLRNRGRRQQRVPGRLARCLHDSWAAPRSGTSRACGSPARDSTRRLRCPEASPEFPAIAST